MRPTRHVNWAELMFWIWAAAFVAHILISNVGAGRTPLGDPAPVNQREPSR